MKKLLVLIFSVFLLSCNQISTEEESRFTNAIEEITDSLKVDIVTYMHSRPSRADQLTRFEERFRQHYVDATVRYEILSLEKENETGKYYYFISRPARSLQANRRGVAGSFDLNAETGKIENFREFVVTFPTTEDELADNHLPLLFPLAKQYHDFTSDTLHSSIIEWPDGRLYYDTVMFEWRYESIK